MLFSRIVIFLLVFSHSLQCNVMEQFIAPHLSFNRESRMIEIPAHIKHIKLDIGLSSSAPMSQYWLSQEADLLVFGFEPDPTCVNTLKQHPSTKHLVGNKLFIIPCALGPLSNQLLKFYITKINRDCSSLFPPVSIPVERVIDVPVFCLSDFFDLFPFNSHPVIDYIKIDAQGSDLDIVKSAGHYLQDHVIYITLEAEDVHYRGTMNSAEAIDSYMQTIGFIRYVSSDTEDPTYVNSLFLEYLKDHDVKIYQKG